MRIRVSDPTVLPDLVSFLERHVSLIVQRLDAHELVVGVLGSFADGGARELDTYVAYWNARYPGAANARLLADADAAISPADARLH